VWRSFSGELRKFFSTIGRIAVSTAMSAHTWGLNPAPGGRIWV